MPEQYNVTVHLLYIHARAPYFNSPFFIYQSSIMSQSIFYIYMPEHPISIVHFYMPEQYNVTVHILHIHARAPYFNSLFFICQSSIMSQSIFYIYMPEHPISIVHFYMPEQYNVTVHILHIHARAPYFISPFYICQSSIMSQSIFYIYMPEHPISIVHFVYASAV